MPRSASRDLADRYLGNRRYFRAFNRLEWWKVWLARLAALGVVGWAAASFLTTRFAAQTTHGPLASVHAPWEAQCEACHRANPGASWLDAQSRWRDFTCEKCHAAPIHHATMTNPNEACSACHHDHLGRDYSLVKLTDEHCVRCHSALASHTAGGSPKYANASSFASDHPPFKSLENHKRHLKFSHSQHLAPGMVLAEGAKNAWRLSDIPKERREEFRLEGQKDDAIVQLDCRNCHSLETNPASRAAGKFFQPINYEKHCGVCHPTTVAPTVTADKKVLPAFNVPHGKRPNDYDAILLREFALKLQSDLPDLFRGKEVRTLHGEKDPKAQAFLENVKATAAKAKDSLLRVGCAKCHDGLPESVTPPAIPRIWMPYAMFDHAAHKMTACLDCHPNATHKTETGYTKVNEREPVNIVGLDSCRKCHSPAGGIRHGCTDCHKYHNGDHPLQGRGADAFAPKPLTIEDFLKGK